MPARDESAAPLRTVGEQAEQRLAPLAPLADRFAREMGELPRRLMLATSLLADAQLLPDWSAPAPELRQAVEQVQALVVSVMARVPSERVDVA